LKDLPNLKSVYEKYHDQGFEIVGIALDEARDEQKLLTFLKKENLPWPQYFPGNGHYTTSEVSQRFGVTGIPATFLLDRQGMIADTNVRGERLEPAVRRLLALQTGADEEAAGTHVELPMVSAALLSREQQP
jgi:peroxiredoxin